MSQRCSEPVCTGRAHAVVQYNEATSRYCKLCLEIFIMQTVERMEFGETVSIAVERARTRNTLPIYRVS